MDVIIRIAHDCALFMHSTQVYGADGKYLGTLGNVDFSMNPLWKPSVIVATPAALCAAPITPSKHAQAY